MEYGPIPFLALPTFLPSFKEGGRKGARLGKIGL